MLTNLLGFFTVFVTLPAWVQTWRQGVPQAKAGLQATVLARADDRLVVNFDPSVLQLMREVRSPKEQEPRAPYPSGKVLCNYVPQLAKLPFFNTAPVKLSF